LSLRSPPGILMRVVTGFPSPSTATPRRRDSDDPGVRQFARFLVVGVSNTVVSFIAYRLLLAVGTPYAAAAPLATPREAWPLRPSCRAPARRRQSSHDLV